MQIVGFVSDMPLEDQVHTIDVWFSSKRRIWCVERLDANGDLIGPSHACADEAEAIACCAEWLRAHPETQLVGPQRQRVAIAARRSIPRKRAA